MHYSASTLKITALFSGLLLSGSAAFSQSKLSVTISDSQSRLLDGITVYLLKSADSTLLKTSLSNAQGLAEFERVMPGLYLVKSGSVNHIPAYSKTLVIRTGDPELKTSLELKEKEAIVLKDVTITAQKPFIQRLADRLVVNVSSSVISAGSNAMDVLERSPGVTLSQNDLIALKGRQGVIVMIDGKPSPIAGADLVAYLRGLPSDAIDRIEIITNPSAKYDAAGNSGIIDIRMKKDQRLGANGTVTGSLGQGVYTKANGSTVLNYRNKKANIFGNVSRSYAKNFNNIFSKKSFFENGIYKSAYDQDNRIERETNSLNFRSGADFFPGKKTIVGFIASGNTNVTDRTGDNSSLVLNQNSELVSKFTTKADGKENFKSFAGNANYKYSWNTAGHELTADADYASYTSDWQSDFNTGYFTPSGGNEKPAYITNSDQDGNLDLKTVKADYAQPIKKGKIETGFKSSWVKADNEVKFYDRSNGTPVIDPNRSNHFIYNENINACYINFYKTLDKMNAQLGLRAEQTNINTYQVEYNARSKQNYTKLFPSIFLSYNKDKNTSFGVSMSRRIDRPSYSQLNPFKIFVDPTFLASGDPKLKPQYTWSSELSFTRKQFYMALNYSHTSDYITVLLIPDPSQSKVTLQTPLNYSTLDYYGLTASSPVRISSWWNTQNNLNVFYGAYQGFIANTDINQGSVRGELSSNNTFTLPKRWTIEFNNRYNAGSNEGGLRVKSSFVMAAGVQKSLMENKATVRFNVSDILWRQWPRAVSTFTDYSDVWAAKRDTRVANLSVSYRFGNNQVAAARRRNTGSEEEKRRASGS